MRRAWASHALNIEQAGLDVVSTVLDHVDISTTRRHYAFTDDERAFKALTGRRI